MRTLATAFIAIVLFMPAGARAGGFRSPLIAKPYSQRIQNERANIYNLSRMQNTAMIQRFHRAGLLDSVPYSTHSYYLYDIAPPYRYLRPWSKLFLDRLSQEYYARFGQRLRVTSLIRTVQSQIRLSHFDPDAAAATGPNRSAHLTGAAMDISKRFMSYKEILWMRHVLYQLKQEGVIYAIEEFVEPDFHVMVYPTYRQYVAHLKAGSTHVAEASVLPRREGDISTR